MILRYLEKVLGSKLVESRKVLIVASPPWCKDDVFVQLLDATPGKRHLIVKFLSRDEENELYKIFGTDVADIVIVLTERGGTGYVVAFNWTKVWRMLRISPQLLRGPTWWWSRLVADVLLLKYLNRPEKFVSIVKTFPVKPGRYRYPEIYHKLGLAGNDPYVILGLIKKHVAGTVPEMLMYTILTAVLSAVVATAVTYLTMRRRGRSRVSQQ